MYAPDSASDAPWDLLARHLTGEATPAEQAALRAWLMERPENLGLLTEATRVWERASLGPVIFFDAVDVDRAWRRFEANIMGATNGPATIPTARPGGKVVPLWGRPAVMWRAAAAAAVILSGTWLAWQLNHQTPGSGTGADFPPVVARAGEARSEVSLPDGSRVWLNRGSELRYAADFNTSHRVVELTGEGFFEVTKQNGHSFTILTPTTRTRVLGTSFNVRAYPHEDSVEVAVTTGQVAFAGRTTEDSVVMRPGQRAVWRKAVPKPIVTAAADANYRAWQRDELVFDNARLDYVARTLEATFNARVVVADEALRQCRFTGTFRKPQLEQVLRVVGVATSAELVQKEDGSWELRGNGCEPPRLLAE